MHWLQTLDTGLFHFINRSLANPFFDWLMPILSGANGAMRGSSCCSLPPRSTRCASATRALRLCVLLMVLVVALGDPLIINTVKHAVARPRPFVTLPDARLFGVVGKGYVPPEEMAANTSSRNSMPSSHAANWFAATMVAFLFYRRSWRFMLPMALAVSFSRVYNGVHYPSDVLAGAILGAGYAAAGVIGVAGRVELDRKKMVSALARANAVAAESSPNPQCRELPSPKSRSCVKSEIGNREIGNRVASPRLSRDLGHA